ncbi:MAG: hypothetical protein J5800_01740 [Spirochaetales bacterium]|nr:hypothetical protein [Spirochaetales bacterium]MBR4426987.1 hypothetical protein [Spirochaetales bacterium]
MNKKDELSEMDIKKENADLSASELSDVSGGRMYVEPGLSEKKEGAVLQEGKDGVFMNPHGEDGSLLKPNGEDGRLFSPNGEDKAPQILSEGRDK